MRLKGKKVIVLVDDLYQELELWVPYYRLQEEGAEVTVVGSGEGRTCTSKLGYPVTVAKEAKEIDASRFDGVVIPGGYAPDLMRRHPEMVKIVKDAYEKGKVVAAICHAGWMLASAGILKGKKVTGFFSIKDDLIHAGGNYVDAEVVRDGNLITSRKPDDLPAFCRELVEALSK
ncbi:MAG: protease [Deltaproteobacteria bacterium RBG_13_52_11b]|nr:MAG: protease [Deltaproteobacteria bacterium RBG_13_52_11b]